MEKDIKTGVLIYLEEVRQMNLAIDYVADDIQKMQIKQIITSLTANIENTLAVIVERIEELEDIYPLK